MKRLPILILFLLIPISVPAQVPMDVTLQWDANTEPDLAGYRIYASTQRGVYTTPIADVQAGIETVTVQVEEGLTFFVATAYDTADPPNESTYSNEVSTTGTVIAGAPNSPTGLQCSE